MTDSMNSGAKRKGRVAGIIGKIVLIPLTIVLFLLGTLYMVVATICNGDYPEARKVFVSTMLETGKLKFAASMFLTEEEINSTVNENARENFNIEVDTSLITVHTAGTYTENVSESEKGYEGKIELGEQSFEKNWPVDEDGDGIIVEKVMGRQFMATVIIVEDPSRVSLSTIYKASGNKWPQNGKTLKELCESAGALGAVNGGLYNNYNNTGGVPMGVVVSNGVVEKNSPGDEKGLVLIGLTEENILVIEPLTKADGTKFTKAEVSNLIKERKIRDACCFQEENSDKNNHFVQLVINGKAREMSGMGSGLNPRTAIGQRQDGAIILLVTDGRGTGGHLGASATDIQNVMLEYGAWNAANLDGGSSSCMYYDGAYLMDSVTFYYKNSSWRLPLAFTFK